MDNAQLSPNPAAAIDGEVVKEGFIRADQPIPEAMDFSDAMREVIKGNKITRLSWKPEMSFCMLKDFFLTIFIRGEFHRWTVNDGDLNATDWVVFP